MSRLLFHALALAAAFSITAADQSRPRILDFNPWSWLPSNSNRSPSVMDYFFPPSRTPKNSNLDPPADRSPPKTNPTTIDETLTTTSFQERSTTNARKSSNKSKLTASLPHTTASPKTKKIVHRTTDTDTTSDSKTTLDITLENVAQTTIKAPTTSTARPTKHYSIRPIIRTASTLTTQETESTLNTNSDSTETVAVDTVRTTVENIKATVSTTSIPEPRSTDAGTASTATESTTVMESTLADEPDSREGYLPLRDKPQQTHVKINEQTKKEVSNIY
ncbi:unnamed protein product [Parnassius apollo]|uniref:(apollo) hypothetical protein n=1 Tax=Parnassius apollo TaxID=110799 RepID=A0A8S3W6Y1_PARAO|nr:unnamed protein product [Parnassius apollo]